MLNKSGVLASLQQLLRLLKDFHDTSRRHNIGWEIKASPLPQVYPREVIEAALSRKTVAIPVPVPAARRRKPKTIAGQ